MSSVLGAIAIVALIYVATHCFNEVHTLFPLSLLLIVLLQHDWPWADPNKWDGRAWRLCVLGYLELAGFWVCSLALI